MSKTPKPKEKEKKDKPKYSIPSNVRFMLRCAWKKEKTVLWLCLVTVVLDIASHLCNLWLSPTILGKVESGAPLKELFLTIAVFTGTLAVLAGLQSYVDTNTLFGRVSVRTYIINLIAEKTCNTSYSNTEKADFIEKCNNANSQTGSNSASTEAVWNTLTSLAVNLICFCIYLTLLSDIDPMMIAVVIVTCTVNFFVSKHVNGWGYRHRDERSEIGRQMDYPMKITESDKFAKDLRMFGMAGWLEDVYQSGERLLRAFVVRGEKVYILTNLTDAVLTFARNGIAYFYLISLTLDEGLSASQFLLYFSAVGGFTSWIGGILSGFLTLHQQSLGLSVLREFLDDEEPFTFAGGSVPEKAESYELKLENVSFRYPNTEKDIIHHMNLTIRPGEKLAIVGLNGAGKTTLVKLLCGLYDPTEGRVLLNSQDIRTFDRREYYALFSSVFQEFSVLDVTLAENVSQVLYENTDEEKVWRCLEKAGLTEKVRSLPDGLHTHIGRYVYQDGIMLSGGETQRLMLARALYKDAPLIVLDEPTAALDPIAENDMYLKYNEMTVGRTAVYISHRLASTRFCDRILLLEDGKIKEEGTHDSLLVMGGRYAELFEVQSRYYREEAPII